MRCDDVVTVDKSRSAWQDLVEITSSIKSKADKSKRRARWWTSLSVGASATIPIVLLVVTNDGWAKVTIALLAAFTVVLGTLNQIERPHERWVLYRRYHRALEAEEIRYRHGIAPYNIEGCRDRALAEMLAETTNKLHAEWEGLIPKSEEVGRLTQTKRVGP